MARNLVMNDLLDVAAKELNIVKVPHTNSNTNTGDDGLADEDSSVDKDRSASKKMTSPVQNHDNDLCVNEVLEEHHEEVYRFCTHDHDVSMGPGRFSFDELLEHWQQKDPSFKKDGGTYPEVRRAGTVLQWLECTVLCTCQQCSSRDTPVALLCEPYPFGPAKGESQDYIPVHKFKWEGEPWAVILGDMDDPVEYRLWGACEDDKPDEILYCDHVLLREAPYGFEKPADVISGKEKRAAQQSIETDDALEQAHTEDGPKPEDVDEDHDVLVRPGSGKRKRVTTGSGKKKQRRTREHLDDDDDDYTPVNSLKRARVLDGNRRAPSKSQLDENSKASQGQRAAEPQSPFPELTKQNGSTRRDGSITSTTTPTNATPIPAPTQLGGKPQVSSKHPLRSQSNNPEPKSPAAPAFPAPVTRPVSLDPSHIGPDPSAPVADISAVYRFALAHVFQCKSSSGLSALTDPAIRDALRALEEVAKESKESDDWAFRLAYGMLDEKLTGAGVDPLPEL